jgi:hypothetical protein
MAFKKILNGFLHHEGVEGVIFLDSEGEAIFGYGNVNPESLKAMGAYQGIVLSSAQRLDAGESEMVITCCRSRSILTRQLKDGYFVCIILLPDANPAFAKFAFSDYFDQLEKEL